jgi:hypothetical protein
MERKWWGGGGGGGGGGEGIVQKKKTRKLGKQRKIPLKFRKKISAQVDNQNEIRASQTPPPPSSLL